MMGFALFGISSRKDTYGVDARVPTKLIERALQHGTVYPNRVID